MFELIITVLCLWLFFKALGLALKLTWGVARILCTILFTIALPLLIGCLLFAGGLLILLPLGLLGLALGVLKAAL